MPIIAAAYRAPLGSADFSLHLTGPSGAGKTEITALAQQHFGAGMDARHLPASWSSTANSLEGQAFLVKDALLAVDDFKPAGSQYDVQRMHQQADRLLRAQGNNAGRGRMRADGSLRPAKPPRGLILSTGEDVPLGHSLRARLLVLEVGPGDVRWPRLTEAQEDAAAGLYSQAMAGYVRWLAARMPIDLRARAAALRSGIDGAHRRTPEIVAHLLTGWHLFVEFALELDAVNASGATDLLTRAELALRIAAASQTEHQTEQEPAARFLALVTGALAAGRAHVASPIGRMPAPAEPWGWRRREGAFEEWQPQGHRIGWLDGGELYLEPEAAYRVAQLVARDSGDSLPLSLGSLKKRLGEFGVLASRDHARETLHIRKTLEGRQRNVLHLSAGALAALSDPDEPQQVPF
ncbi:MAG: DUF927 domain-containing protein [Gemmatimonadetes bacterium]|nr:DUF927 domain-containing protein [Gemmatimonadota bacterium]